MATSPLIDVTRMPQPAAPGRDNDALGPSDSSDSGSDVAGLADLDPNDQDAPVDVALGPASQRPQTVLEVMAHGADSDASGSGERRSAGLDAGEREAADILPDHVVGANAFDDEAAGALLAATDDARDGEDEDEEDEDDEEDEEDEDADPVGDNDEGDDVVQVPKR